MSRSWGTWLWLLGSLGLGCIWLLVLCLPFLSAGDHLWQQEVTSYQGNLALFCFGLILLAIPLKPWLPDLLKDRRWLGLLVFGFALAHTLSGFTHTLGGDWQGWAFLGPKEQVALGLGLVALGGLAVLAATSNEAAVQALGAGWKTLHRWLFYPVLGLTVGHTVLWGVNYQSPWAIVGLVLTTLGLVGLRWVGK